MKSWRFILAGLAATVLPIAGLAETFKPLDLRAAGPTRFAADPRLHPGAIGSVEMLVAIDTDKIEGDDPVCLVQHGDARTGVNYRISYLPGQNGFALHRGDVAEGVQSRGGIGNRSYVHLAVVTAGGHSYMIIDNVLIGGRDDYGAPDQTERFSYLPPRPEGRPLILGCDGDESVAPAWIASLRIWNRVIDRSTLQKTKPSLGFPADAAARPDGLAAYSVLTKDRTEIRYPRPAISFTEFAGSSEGTPFFLARPAGKELAAIYMHLPSRNDSGTRPERWKALNDFRLEFGHPDRLFDMTEGGVVTMPHILGVGGTTLPDLGRVGFLEDQIADLLKSENPDPFAVDDLKSVFFEDRQAVRRAWLGLKDQDGVETFGETEDGRAIVRVHRIEPGAPEHLLRVSGLHDGRRLTSLRFETTRGQSELFHSDRFGNETFTLRLPLGTRFEGIAGRHVDGEITAIALAYSKAPHPVLGGVPWSAMDQIWVDRDDRAPTHNVDAPGGDAPLLGGPSLITGNYSDQKAYRIHYDTDLAELVIFVTNPNQVHDPSDVTDREGVHRFLHAEGRRWNNASVEGSYLILGNERIHWIGADEVYERVLVRPASYPAPHREQLPWGATFSLDQRPPSIEASFRGYHPYFMRARDYEATTGTDKFLFKLPEDDSKKYTTTGAHVIVPHGLFFRRDVKGSEQQTTSVMETADDRQYQWNLNLGVKGGIPLLFSFNVDYEYTHGQQAMKRTSESMALTRTIATHYAFVMDLARIELHPEFRARILELRDRKMLDRKIDWNLFFKTWGTHYPYAVTYGGMAWMESGSDALDVSQTTTDDVKASVSAEGTFEEVFNIGGKVGGGYNQSITTGGGSESEIVVFGSNGGSFSRGGGWSLARGEEVPLLLDLRQITELLNPVMFEDPGVFFDLRKTMQSELDDYMTLLAEEVQVSGWASIRADTGDDFQ